MKNLFPFIRTPARSRAFCAALLVTFALGFGASAHAQTPGAADSTFNVGLGADTLNVRALAVQADGKIIVGGAFGSFEGSTSQGVVRLNPDGSLDPAFNVGGTGIDTTGTNLAVYALALQPDGKILVGGIFTSYNGAAHGNIVRLLPDGTPDPAFNGGTGIDERVFAIALQSDGKIVIGGQFITLSGVAVNSTIARMMADGSADTSFSTQLIRYGDVGGASYDGEIESLAIQADGKIIAGGGFDTGALFDLARINPDGTDDPSFASNFSPNEDVYAIAIQTDGKILIGGPLQDHEGAAEYDGVLRLNADGNLDTTFDPDLGTNDYFPHAIAIQPDGKILIGGSADFTDGPQGVVRINADGTYDAAYSAGTNTEGGTIYALAVQADNNALAGGGYSTSVGAPGNDLFRVIGGPLAVPTPAPTPVTTPTPAPTPVTTPTPPPTPSPTTPTVTLTASSTKLPAKGGKAKLVLTRTGDTSAALTVSYSVKGSAVNGKDYKGLTGSAEIPAGSSSVTFKLKAKDDGSGETHVLKLALTSGSGYTPDPAAHVKIKILGTD